MWTKNIEEFLVCCSCVQEEALQIRGEGEKYKADFISYVLYPFPLIVMYLPLRPLYFPIILRLPVLT